MIILDENERPIIIDDVTTPVLSDYFWVLDLAIRDYTLTYYNMSEEIVGPTMMIEIRGFTFALPANWCILIVADDTSQLDIAEVGDISGKDHKALIYGLDIATPILSSIRTVDFDQEGFVYAPSLGKHQMLCHPVGQNEWVNVAQSDVYNKYLKDCTIGDII